MSRRTYFVTGTDTGVGKTLVATALLLAARERSLRSIGLKPVAAGCELRDASWQNADAIALRDAATIPLAYKDVNPIALRAAIAPHIAMVEEDIQTDVTELAAHCEGLVVEHSPDFALLEGAGGWQVPLNANETLADLAAALHCPVILVVGLRLGCINHSLLTAAAIQAQGLPLVGWIGSSLAAMERRDENLDSLRQRLPAPCLGVIPDLGPSPNAKDAVSYLDFDALMRPVR